MRKLLTLFILLSIQSSWAQAPLKPFYFDLSYQRIEKGSRAEYYATHTPIANSKLSDITIYRIETDAIVAKGKAVWNGEKIAFQSNVYTYLPDGKILSIKYYDKHKNKFTHEVSYNPATNDSLVMLHEPSSRYAGEIYDSYSGKLFYTRTRQEIPSTEIVYNLTNQANKLVVTYSKEYESIDDTYYNEKGTKKYFLTFKGNEPYEGKNVILSDKSFAIAILSDFVKGQEFNRIAYYSTGEIKQKNSLKNGVSKQETFDKTGKLLGTYTEKKVDENTATEKSGVKYVFKHLFVDFDAILEEQHYKNDQLQKKVSYEYAQKTKYASIVTLYKNSYPYLTEYFDVNRQKVDQATYFENSAKIKDGLQINSMFLDIYWKNGENIKEINKYYSQAIFSIETPTLCTYYSEEGKELGKITIYEGFNGHRLSDSGDGYILMYDIPLLTTKYKNKEMVYKAKYAFDKEIPHIASEKFYNAEQLTQENLYYNNGNLKEQLFSTDNKREEYSLYYDSDGKQIGKYDSVNRTGTKYTINTEDQIEKAETFEKGVLTHLKQYSPTIQGDITTLSPLYLQADIYTNKEGLFYNAKGELWKKCTYKDGRPYTGTTVVYENDKVLMTPYVNGEKQGVQTTTTSNPKYIERKHYNKAQLLYTEETFDGITTFVTYFDNKNEISKQTVMKDQFQLAEIIYRNNQPYEGTQVELVGHTTIWTTFVNGQQKRKQTKDTVSNIVITTQEYDNNTQSTLTHYNIDGSIQYRYGLDNKKHLQNDFLINTPNNKTYKAKLYSGRIAEGTIAIYDYWDRVDKSYKNSNNYILLSCSDDVVTIQKIDKETHQEVSKEVKNKYAFEKEIFNSMIGEDNLYLFEK
ncbi:MAG: hypothetical protein LBE34_09805 [Flavobacteriaceae bacterium]|jgi:hypothetical protein|nr:hypothetical protein [Flavobacteriaceae bacterium]